MNISNEVKGHGVVPLTLPKEEVKKLWLKREIIMRYWA